MNEQDMITQRYHDIYQGKKVTVGVFVGVVEDGLVRTGWSRASLYTGDKFDMRTGIDRAIYNMVFNKPIPQMSNYVRQENFIMAYENFKDRCRRYFKQAQLEEDSSPIDEDIYASLREQFAGQGVDEKTIKDFIRVGMPLAKSLYAKGVHGLGIPIYGGNPILSKIDVKDLEKSILGGIKKAQENETDEVPKMCEGCGGLDSDSECFKRYIKADGSCEWGRIK